MKTVMEMAREAGFLQEHILHSKALEQFADLIRADERDAVLNLADSLGWVDVDDIKARGNK